MYIIYALSLSVTAHTQPMLESLWAHSLSVVTPVVVSDERGQNLGCAKVFMSPMCHLYSISTPGQLLEEWKKKTLEQPITKFTQATLVG